MTTSSQKRKKPVKKAIHERLHLARDVWEVSKSIHSQREKAREEGDEYETLSH